MSAWTAAALVALAGLVAWLLSGPDGALRRARWVAGAALPGPALPASRPGGPGPSRLRLGKAAHAPRRLADLARTPRARELLGLAAGAVAAAALRSPLPALAGLAAVPLLRRRARRRAEQRLVALRRAGVIELCSGVAGELRTGSPPHQVLAQAVADSPWMAGRGLPGAAGVLAAARFGGDVPGALRRAAAAPGAGGLAGMAACWQVAVDGGSGLADGLDRVAAALREREQQRDELRAQLAGPRSTAALLAGLPAVGLLLGTAMGADPLRVLLHTPAGLGCLALGGALEWAGLAWTARIVRGAG